MLADIEVLGGAEIAEALRHQPQTAYSRLRLAAAISGRFIADSPPSQERMTTPRAALPPRLPRQSA